MFSNQGGGRRNHGRRRPPFRGGRGRWSSGHDNHRNHLSGGRGRGRRRRDIGQNRRNNNDPSNFRYRPSAFDPIEEIGDLGAQNTVRIAVEGCCHGELDLLYDRLLDHQKTSGKKIDLLICCGDFQSLRNPADFFSSSIPPKYRRLGDFPKYYSGEKKAPILTVFIGGNHEASQPLRELYYGGFVAPNIYYLGAAGVVQYRGIRIGGISGIYKSHDYRLGHHEKPPYDYKATKSVYHVRKIDVERIKLLAPGTQDRMDVFVSHDWPLGIEQHGDTEGLIRKKPFFKGEIERNDLGSLPNKEILDALKPKYWFSAHLHVKFHATVVHSPCATSNPTPSNEQHRLHQSALLVPSQALSKHTVLPSTSATRTETFVSSTAADKVANKEHTTEFHAMESSQSKCNMNGIPDLTEQMTKFLALDKCLPRRQFLSILNIPLDTNHGTSASSPSSKSETTLESTPIEDSSHQNQIQMPSKDTIEKTEMSSDKSREDTPTGDESSITSASPEYHLEYDPEWLAILKRTHHWTTSERCPKAIPPMEGILSDDSTSSDCHDTSSWVVQRFKDVSRVNESTKSPPSSSCLEIPRDFIPTVPFANDPFFVGGGTGGSFPLPPMGNPQTDYLLGVLELDHIITRPFDPALTQQGIVEDWNRRGRRADVNKNDKSSPRDYNGGCVHRNPSRQVADDNEIDIDDDESENEGTSVKNGGVVDENEIDNDNDDTCDEKNSPQVTLPAPIGAEAAVDSNEIDLDDESMEDGSPSSIEITPNPPQIPSKPQMMNGDIDDTIGGTSKKARLTSPTSKKV